MRESLISYSPIWFDLIWFDLIFYYIYNACIDVQNQHHHLWRRSFIHLIHQYLIRSDSFVVVAEYSISQLLLRTVSDGIMMLVQESVHLLMIVMVMIWYCRLIPTRTWLDSTRTIKTYTICCMIVWYILLDLLYSDVSVSPSVECLRSFVE